MSLNCVAILSNTKPAQTLKNYLNNHVNLQVLTTLSTAKAVSNYNFKNVQLLVVETKLPNFNGFKFYKSLKKKPQVIFVSTNTEDAYNAFNCHATDFLKLPVSKARFNQAINKALDLHLLYTEIKPKKAAFIVVKSNLKNYKVFIDDIKWIEALGDYIKLVTEQTSLVVLSSMKAFEPNLKTGNFFRTHKSYIVNLDKVDAFANKSLKIDNYTLPLSRSKKPVLEAVLGYKLL